MRRLILYSIICLSFFSVPCSGEEQLNVLLRDAVESISAACSQPELVAVGNITYSDKQIGSKFSAYLSEQLKLYIREDIKFYLADTDNMDQIIEQMKMSLSENTKGSFSTTKRQIFRPRPVD